MAVVVEKVMLLYMRAALFPGGGAGGCHGPAVPKNAVNSLIAA